jgi:hypothetical protein
MRIPIPDGQLAPGDSVELWYEILGGNEYLQDLAISKVDAAIESNSRLIYRGYRFEGLEKTEDYEGFPAVILHKYVVFTVKLREQPAAEVTAEGPVYEANLLLAIVEIVGLIGATITVLAVLKYLKYDHQLTFRENKNAMIESIVVGDEPDEVKTEALKSLTDLPPEPPSVGEQVQQAGQAIQGIGMGLALLFVGAAIYLVSKRKE